MIADLMQRPPSAEWLRFDKHVDVRTAHATMGIALLNLIAQMPSQQDHMIELLPRASGQKMIEEYRLIVNWHQRLGGRLTNRA
jgi:hypothetical protein